MKFKGVLVRNWEDKMFFRFDSIRLALISVLSALYAILYYIPIGFPLIGLEGAKPISIAYFMALLIALLFPVEISFTSVALGGLIISIIQFSPPFYLLNFLPGAVMALVTSLYFRNELYSLVIYLVFLMAYVFYPGGGVFYTYPYHALPHALVLLTYTILNASVLPGFIAKYKDIISPLLLGAFSGQATGTTLFLMMYYGVSFLSPEAITPIWVFTLYVYPIERLVLIVGTLVLYLGVKESVKRYVGESVRIPMNL